MSRASDGTYTRPSNSFTNPVTGTAISSTDADTFFDDLETALTDSYSRSIKGGMTADGTASLPAFTWSSDLNTGIYRIGADNVGIAAGGTKIVDVGASGANITGAGSAAFAVGANGTTNPVLQVDASASSVATGLKVTGAAAASRTAVAVISSGTNEGLSVDAKGSGTIRLGATSTGAVEFSRNAVPTASDGAALGTTALPWSDIFIASGAVIDFNNGDVTVTHSSNALAFAGASSGYSFDAVVKPASSDGAALGTSALMWSDLFLASGAVVNFNNGNLTLTHSAGDLALAGGTLTLPNSGLHLFDTDSSHDLIITPGSNLTADRVFTLTTGDAARTLDISAGSVTITAAGAAMTGAASAAAQTALLSNVVGDSGSGGTKGLVPAPAAGDAAATKFLRADGTWAAVSGAGVGDVTGPASSADNAAARFDGTGGKTLQNSVLIIADTTGALSRTGSGGIPVQGTNTNDSASAGDIGEYISGTLVFGSAISLTASTAANVTSISLTAGDWDVSGMVYYVPAATTSVTRMLSSFSTTSATFSTTNGQFWDEGFNGVVLSSNGFHTHSIPTARFSVSSTTTLYLVAYSVFTVSTMTAFGLIGARRVR